MFKIKMQLIIFFYILGFSGGRRDSVDRNSQTAFSPSLIDQYNKNKQGWPNYGPLGNPAGKKGCAKARFN